MERTSIHGGMRPDWLSEIDHTGDVGIRVTAPDRPALYARAAWGAFSILTDLSTVRATASREIQVEGEDPADLMARWLAELNFVHITEGWLFSQFDVTTVTDNTLIATVSGEPIDPDRHTVYTEIKAVTYHELVVEDRNGSWHAQIIFDM